MSVWQTGPPRRRWLRVLLGVLVSGLGLATGFLASAWFSTTVPGNLDDAYHQMTTIYYSDGVTEIGQMAQQRRVLIELADLPQVIGDAVIASEDGTFWTNPGIDPRGIVRAMINNFQGNPRQGASTITQQFVENYFGNIDATYLGQLREAILAVKITNEFPKEDILQGYLNTIFWGRGAFGVEAASQAYFGHSASELSLSEAALLAGVIPAPNAWDPGLGPESEAIAQQRWARTLNLMAANGTITPEQAANAVFPDTLPRPDLTMMNAGQAGYLMREVVRELSADPLFADNDDLETRGLRIITTIDYDLQEYANEIANSIPRDGPEAASPNLQMALVAINPGNGEIETLWGGEDYQVRQFNNATDGRAQAGSTFKPFTLIAALEEGIPLETVINGDSPRIFDWYGEEWEVNNFASRSFGNINLITAMENSVNTVFAELNIFINPQSTGAVAHRLGIPGANPGQPGFIDGDSAANVLGSAAIRPVDMAAAYATMAANGIRTTPHIVRSVTDLTGHLIYLGPTGWEEVMDPQVAAANTHALEAVVRHGSGVTAQGLRGPDGEWRPSAGKTGTSQNNVSAWYAGYTPQLATVVSIHQDLPDGTGEETITPFGQWAHTGFGMTGSTFPVTAWTEFMQAALAGQPVVPFPEYVPLPCNPELDPHCVCDPAIHDYCPDPYEGWVTVPTHLILLNEGQAAAELHAVGLNVTFVYEPHWEPVGLVIHVDHAGERVPPGTVIRVVLSNGAVPHPAPPPPPEPEPEPEPPAPEPPPEPPAPEPPPPPEPPAPEQPVYPPG